MKLYRHPMLYMGIYLLCAIVAFGHSWHHAFTDRKDGTPMPGDFRSCGSLFIAMLWPLYVSYLVFEPAQPEVQP